MWATSPGVRKARVTDVVHSAPNSKRVRTKPLVKNGTVLLDGTPDRQRTDSGKSPTGHCPGAASRGPS